MKTLLWLIVVLVLWQSGLLSSLLWSIGAFFMWIGNILL